MVNRGEKRKRGENEEELGVAGRKRRERGNEKRRKERRREKDWPLLGGDRREGEAKMEEKKRK